MPPLASHELLSRLKKGKPVPAILLLGAEPYLRDICRAQLIEQYVPEAARTWAVSRFSAERGDIQAALDQAQTLPMLSPQQVVFLENTEAIEEFADKKREAAVELLESYLADPAPFTVLVLEAAQLDQRMKLSKLLVEKSLVVAVGLGDDPNQRNAAAVALARSLAKEQGVEYDKAVFPWAASGRALGMGREEGLTKVLYEKGSKRILGAGIVGVNAGELIAETVLALEMGADAEDIGLTIHPHPTLSETVYFTAEMAEGTITDMMPPKR